jgi:hypothetical protein
MPFGVQAVAATTFRCPNVIEQANVMFSEYILHGGGILCDDAVYLCRLCAADVQPPENKRLAVGAGIDSSRLLSALKG